MPPPARTPWLAGTAAAVTRADGALGRAVASSLASRRLSLALVGTQQADLDATAREVSRIRALHQNEEAPLVVEADVDTPEGVQTLQATTSETVGPLDALVHVVELGEAGLLAAATAAVVAGVGGGLIRRGGALVLAVLAGPWRAADRPAAMAEVTDALSTTVRAAACRWERQIAVNGLVLSANAKPDVRALGFEALSGAALPATAVSQTANFYEAARIVRFLASREAQALTGHTLTVGAPLAEAA